MSYSIPKGLRYRPSLTKTDRNEKVVALQEYYGVIRKVNNTREVNEPKLAKYLEYVAYSASSLPKHLKKLKSEVHTFFKKIVLGANPKDRKSLFTHFIMRNCNAKEIPISIKALCNGYREIFEENLETYNPRRVSDICGLYLIKEDDPRVYLTDTDTIDDLFGGISVTKPPKKKAKVKVKVDNEETVLVNDIVNNNSLFKNDDNVRSFYDSINPQGFGTPLKASEIKELLVHTAYLFFDTNLFSLDDMVERLCTVYKCETLVWGLYSHRENRPLLKKIISDAYATLRGKGMLKIGKGRTNYLTSKGKKFSEKGLKTYKQNITPTTPTNPLNFNSNLDIDYKLFSIDEEYNVDTNQLYEIILLSHYDLNRGGNNFIDFRTLVEKICSEYSVDIDVWGSYRTYNNTMLEKKVTQFKRKGVDHKMLTSYKGSTALTQLGVDTVESWFTISDERIRELLGARSEENAEDIIDLISEEEHESVNDEDISITPTDNVVPLKQASDTTVSEELFSKDEDEDVGEYIGSATILAEDLQSLINIAEADTTEERNEDDSTDYDQLLKDTLAENDELTAKNETLNLTVSNLISFLKDKDLLTEYIISLNKDAIIPF